MCGRDGGGGLGWIRGIPCGGNLCRHEKSYCYLLPTLLLLVVVGVPIEMVSNRTGRSESMRARESDGETMTRDWLLQPSPALNPFRTSTWPCEFCSVEAELEGELE